MASYAIDDKGAVTGLLDLAGRITRRRAAMSSWCSPRVKRSAAPARLYYARRTEATAAVALEVMPVAKEYGIALSADPVLIAADSYGPLHDALGRELAGAAVGGRARPAPRGGLELRVGRLGDAWAGNIARTACLAFPPRTRTGSRSPTWTASQTA